MSAPWSSWHRWSGPVGEEARRLDLRLLLPALLAWAVLVAVLPHPPWVAGMVAAGAALTALACLGLRTRVRDRVLVLGFAGAAIALVCGSGALHLATARSGPVPDWAAQGAVTQARLLVTTEPRVIARGDERQPLVVLEATVLEARSRGQVSTPRTPVVVFADDPAWAQARWRSEVLTQGRWAPAEPGQRAVAVLTPRGPPETAGEPLALLRGVDHVRDRFRTAVGPLPTDPRGLVPGLVIGDTSLTPPDLTQAMRDTGMTHLSAVSGSNVAIVVGGVALLAARCGLPRRWRTPVVLLALVGFVLLCRPEPSVLRAGVMGTVGLLALTSGRQRATLPALGAAVTLLLCVDPWLARSYGFALSALATLGLVLWARPWGLWMADRLPRWAELPARAAAVPLAAQVICAPVIVLLQGSVTTVAVLANVLAAPLVPPTTVLGVASAVVAPLWLPAATALAWAAALPAWVIARVARVCSRLPYGTLDWVDGVAGAWLLTALTVAALLTGPWWLARARGHPWAVAALSLVGVVLVAPVPGVRGWPPPGWVVAGCDVGQGDAFVLRSGPGTAVMVDTGPDPAAASRCLRDLDVDVVELLVLTHFHADHVGGLSGVLGSTEVESVLVSPLADPPENARRTRAQLAAAGIPVRTARAGEHGAWGQARVRVLAPASPLPPGLDDANNSSVVLDVEVAGTSVLLTGDLEPEGARPLRALLRGREVDVLKVAHHGSAAQDEVLTRQLDPTIALIGVGADNTFGHPAPSALGLLQEIGAVVLRTDLHGDVAVARDELGRLVPHARE
ncbi:ComEC/Rec2 family competence protein [Serinicoccus sp. LYQ131]|uniref:ComEC/Rec2 family competence protein n=1 Tax=Serinicoccus sp. LYQ131 TaxID=3378797 RepID=UPI003854739D